MHTRLPHATRLIVYFVDHVILFLDLYTQQVALVYCELAGELQYFRRDLRRDHLLIGELEYTNRYHCVLCLRIS